MYACTGFLLCFSRTAADLQSQLDDAILPGETPEQKEDDKKKKLSGGAIAGIVIGSVVGAAILAAVA